MQEVGFTPQLAASPIAGALWLIPALPMLAAAGSTTSNGVRPAPDATKLPQRVTSKPASSDPSPVAWL